MRLPKILAAAVAVALGSGAAAAVEASGGHSASAQHPGVALASDNGSPTGYAPGSTAASGASGPGTTLSAGAAKALGLRLPASGIAGALSTPTGTGTAATARADLPTPTKATLPRVTALRSVAEPDAVVLLNAPVNRTEALKLRTLKGVSAVDEADTGTVNLAGAPAVTFGVDPGTFRSFTPAASASSEPLWRYLAGGSLVSSYEMATDRNLKLGSEESMTPAGGGAPVHGWLGAFASIGLPGVDMLVSHQYSSDLGLMPDSGLVVSAPGLAGNTLQSELQSAIPGAAVELLHADQFPANLVGNALSQSMRSKIIAAALSRVGRPYVWGGAGPGVFDCSGLVQWSYRQAGVLMPRTADEQFLTGIHIPLADAAPGDLLFWTYDPSDPGFVDHTAIYLGNGLMVVAPHTGLDVEVVPVPTSNFAGAVQVVLGS